MMLLELAPPNPRELLCGLDQEPAMDYEAAVSWMK